MEDKPLRDKPAEFKQWGTGMDEAQQQMKNACDLPISHSGALMADSHIGYGLPIGGVLATRNSVIPYAVGVDICLLYTSPSPRDATLSRMPSSA